MFDQSIDNLNRERGVSFSQTEESIYLGEVTAGEEKVWLSIDLGQGFPKAFPKICVVDGKRFMPHLSSEGKLCLFDESSVMIKPDSPEQLLLDSYDRAIEILEMDPETQKEEVFREFFAYWGNQSQAGFMLYTNLATAETHEFQEYTVIGNKVNRLIVSDNLEESKALLINHMGCTPSEAEKYKIPCYRIRLRSSSLPRMNESFTWKNIRSYILDNITGSQKRRFNQMLSEKCSVVNRLLLLTIPSYYGDQYACIWMHHNSQKRKSALKNISDCKIDAVTTVRIDPQYLLVRGGAEKSIMQKSVLLIGCGSVGGFLADNLCQCGIGTLDLLDKDILTTDNIHRHVLGFDDAILGKYKADLLKTQLESRFPYVDIDSLSFVDRTAETLIKTPNRFLHYDLIVSATGNPALDLEINDELYKIENAPPFVVCFNEPYGIGGHAIAILKGGGCLRCLYSDPISGELVPFQGSFTKEGQSFTKNISGCSSAFVEYSVLDSQQTAIMTSRLIIDVLTGRITQTQLVSWIGSAERLRDEGYQTSEYYNELELKGVTSVSRDISCSKRCRTCGSLC